MLYRCLLLICAWLLTAPFSPLPFLHILSLDTFFFLPLPLFLLPLPLHPFPPYPSSYPSYLILSHLPFTLHTLRSHSVWVVRSHISTAQDINYLPSSSSSSSTPKRGGNVSSLSNKRGKQNKGRNKKGKINKQGKEGKVKGKRGEEAKRRDVNHTTLNGRRRCG